ncbi:MAG: hypothetical protein WC860_07555 [Candidatus Margulisiibacteriota bacterium]
MKKFGIGLALILFTIFILFESQDLNALPRKKSKKSTYSQKTLPTSTTEAALAPETSAYVQPTLPQQISLPAPTLPTASVPVEANATIQAAPPNPISASATPGTNPTEVTQTATPAIAPSPLPATIAPPAQAPATPPTIQLDQKQIPPILITDFESGTYTKNPEWWKFDRINISVVENDPAEIKTYNLGKYSLLIEGSTISWYIGGFGTYVGKDFSKYDTIELMVYGNGPGNGQLKIEMIDDDNNNWVVDTDPTKGWEPTKDDKFSYLLDIDWTGWKLVQIPLSDFQDDNPGIGDDKLNSDQKKGSGGLVTLQFIALSSGKAIGKIDAKIDHIKFIRVY